MRKVMKWILLYATLAAMLIVLLKHTEAWFFMGQLPAKVYFTIVGILFLALGTLVGLQFRKKRVEAQVTKVADSTILSQREKEVLEHLIAGLSNKEIADRLFVSENTIKKHVNSIYTKLGVGRRTQAIAKARELGLIR